MKKFLLLLLIIMCSYTFAQTSPDYIFGNGGVGTIWSWTTGTAGTASLGGSYKWQWTASASTDQYFKFGETASTTDGSGFWYSNSGNLLYNGAGTKWTSYYFSNMGADGSYYFTPNGGNYYVIKTKKQSGNNADFAVFDNGAQAPVAISSISRSFSSPNLLVDVTLSGGKSANEKVWVRFTANDWTTSSTVEASSDQTNNIWQAAIKAVGGTVIKYYAFTTIQKVTAPVETDADFYTVAYNNNGSNYEYTRSSGDFYIGALGTGPGGTNPEFSTLKSACDFINASSVFGNSTFYITSDLTESVNVGLGVNTNTYTITFKPYTGKTPSINFLDGTTSQIIDGHFVIGSPTYTSLNLVSTDKIIIDGSNSSEGISKDLTINGPITTSQRSVIRIFGDNDDITIKNCTIISNCANSSTNASILVTNYISGSNLNPDNLTIQNNTLTATIGTASSGFMVSNSGSPTVGMNNLKVYDNIISGNLRGVFVSYTNNADIYGNTITVASTGATTNLTAYGITVQTNFATNGVFNIYNNKLTSLTTNCNTSGASNGITGIDNQNTANHVVNIYNNFIGGFGLTGSPNNVRMYGIRVTSTSTSNIYNNTIHIPELTNIAVTNNIAGIAMATAAAPEASPSASAVVNIKNNIIKIDESTMKVWGIRRVGSTGTFTSNYNNVYINPSNTSRYFGFFNATDYQTLESWRTGSSQDANSISLDPLFHTTTNLHVLPNSPVANIGTPISTPSITTDIDGDLRNGTTPDIGADEFTSISASTSGTATNPTLSTDNPVIPTSGAGGVTFNPSASLTGTVSGYYFSSGRTGSAPAGIANISPYFWALSTNISTFTASVRFYYDQISGNGIVDNTKIKLLRRTRDGEAWSEYTDLTKTATYIQANNLTGFSEFAFGSDATNPLPVELNKFVANVSKNSVILNWSTATETQNAGWEIEKRGYKVEGSKVEGWKNVGFVNGSHNSNAPKNYTFTDNNVLFGQYEYRLKQVDLDGTVSYSSAIIVSVGAKPTEFALYANFPNPFNPTTKIRYAIPQAGKVTLNVYNSVGQLVTTLVDELTEPGVYEKEFDGKNLSSGIYVYTLTSDNVRIVKKMLLVK